MKHSSMMVVLSAVTAALVAAAVVGVPAEATARASFSDHTDKAFLNDALAAVNAYRAKHGAPKVALDNTAIAYAKKRAAVVSTKSGLSHGHAGLDKSYGENLHWSASSKDGEMAPASKAVKAWYDEIKDYNFKNPNFSGKTGHFTQLVWKGSTKIGAARVTGREPGKQWYETYIVMVFQPPGNMMGEFAKNVGRPL
jgi:uncharacterized protein YkwD